MINNLSISNSSSSVHDHSQENDEESYDEEVPSLIPEEEFRECFTSDTYDLEYINESANKTPLPVIRTMNSTTKATISGCSSSNFKRIDPKKA